MLQHYTEISAYASTAYSIRTFRLTFKTSSNSDSFNFSSNRSRVMPAQLTRHCGASLKASLTSLISAWTDAADETSATNE